MARIEADIKAARPGLHSVAPLTYSVCWGYAITNMLLGVGMFFLYATTVDLAVASLLSYQAWGVIFFVMGLVKAHGLVQNNWVLIRKMLLAGLLVKSVWAIALIIRCFSPPQTIIITLVWLFFAYIQAVTYVYFIPKKYGGSRSGR